jgi:PKD repeat protein
MNIKFTILFILISLVLFTISVAPVSAENTTANYSFVHLSDTQGLVYFPSLYNQTFTEIESLKSQYNISAIFITGDLTDGRLTDLGESKDYPIYLQAISHTTIPVYEVSGNHDVFNTVGNFTMWDTYVPSGSQKHDYGFVFNDFVVYGFGWSPTDQVLNTTARTGMINTIAANPTKMPIILTHGYFVPYDGEVTGNRDIIAYDILNASTRDSIILSGHTHTPTQLWYAQQVKYNNFTVIEEFNNAQDWKIDEVQLSIGRLFTVTTDGSHITNLTTQDVYFNPEFVVNNTVAYNVTLYQPPSYQPPISNFTANVTSGDTPLSVGFTDTSSNTPTSWNWSFTNVTGDNTQVWFSTEQNPAYTFGVGNYSIVLNASNSAGFDLSEQVTFIDVTSAPMFPVANFTANVTNGLIPLTVKFTDTSTGTGISAWNWDFNNDGAVDSTVQSPEYTYSNGGMYTVNLTVSDTVGSDSEVKTNYIMAIIPTLTPTPIPTTIPTPMLPPVASFTANVTAGLAPLGIQFNDTSTGAPTTWNWSFTNVTGNNTPVWFSTQQNPAYTFGVGNYSVVLNASNSDGYNLSAQVTFINVTAAPIRTTNVGVFRGLGYWYLDTNNNGTWDGSPPDTEFTWGKQPGDVPITGDWNRDGITETGIFRAGGHWYLDTNNNGTWDGSPPDTEFTWGKQPGDIPITGDWNGNGITETGIFRPGTGFYLDMNNNGQYDGPSIDRFLPWGLLQPSDKPVTGKW